MHADPAEEVGDPPRLEPFAEKKVRFIPCGQEAPAEIAPDES
jgi:hypothetical protein